MSGASSNAAAGSRRPRCAGAWPADRASPTARRCSYGRRGHRGDRWTWRAKGVGAPPALTRRWALGPHAEVGCPRDHACRGVDAKGHTHRIVRAAAGLPTVRREIVVPTCRGRRPNPAGARCLAVLLPGLRTPRTSRRRVRSRPRGRSVTPGRRRTLGSRSRLARSSVALSRSSWSPG